ncbi:hypothetical protein V6N13_110092 [Hibiscus sabdariffa]|uniref:Uncharacterized protein n=1 Tax=Hibiscus sabdariffa TaxID=183260 RepID=A0ABR2BTV7_9ROSI
MSVSWRHKCLLFTLLAFIVISESSRLPKEYWEQMLPKKLPTPSSSPSKGTNSLKTSTPKTVKTDVTMPSSDGKSAVCSWTGSYTQVELVQKDGIED